MIDMATIIGLGFIIIGIGFDFLGCLGLIRFPDVYNRLQASTKCVTFGTCSILWGTFLISGFTSGGIKSLLALVFVLLTSPTAAHALARASHRGGIKLWEKSVCDEYEISKIKRNKSSG
jgi:multicomponent Na+:H+ antiporter subunit G